ncbi:MAG: transporter substrate-binding domain-containing protein [Bacillota bacterium]|nr:transporter substrate-binding domain-containing protein [Bacillota bacterium]
MKKVLSILLICCLAFALCACGGESTDEGTTDTEATTTTSGSQSLEDIKAAGEIVIFTNAEFPPFEYRDDNNEIAGVDVDIAKEIANDIGVELVIEDVNFDSIVASVQSGKAAFGAAGMTVTEERSQQVDFSIEYISSKQYVILPEGESIENIEDLNGKVIGVQSGTTGDFIISDAIEGTDEAEAIIPEAEAKGYTSAILASQDLLSGRLDAVVIDKLPAENIAAANSEAGLTTTELMYADGSDTTENYAICVQKGNTELLEAINATIQRLMDEGAIDQYVVTHSEAGAVSE